uniref:N-acetyltransferase ECO1 n=1 Tax=Plectus sambesii TaxID=2011161 RepID=A0A914VVA1_9BILA
MPQSRLTDFFASPSERRPMKPAANLASISSAMRPSCSSGKSGVQETVITTRKRRLDDEDPKQQVIDAGQKLFGHTQCRECGMVYSVSLPSDVDAHSKHHDRQRLTDWNTLDARTAREWRRRLCAVQEFSDGHIYQLSEESPPVVLTRFEALVVDDINPALGFSANLPLWRSDRQAFIFLTDEHQPKIAGMVIVEPISTASKADMTKEVENATLIGVNRLWVHWAYRKRGIASRLLDCARCNLIAGYPVSRTHCAFSDPTVDGRLFALRFVGGEENLLVYRLD